MILMDILRSFFFLRRIYSRPTMLRISIIYSLMLLGIFFLRLSIAATEESETTSPWIILVWLAIPIAVYVLARAITQYYIVSQALSSDSDTNNRYEIKTMIGSSAMSYELDSADHIKMLAGENRSWQMYTATFDLYQQTKYGEYLARESFYIVFEGVLTRPVPHLIFDGKRAKGRQYKKLYLQSQRMTLEGNFEKYFDVYSPEHYQIDTLSFITPDVMEALIALQDYDIELIYDRVLCAGPLLTTTEQEELQRKCLVLMQELNHNLKTYRDNRLSKQKGKTAVTPFARALLKSPRKYLPRLIVTIIWLIGSLYDYSRYPVAERLGAVFFASLFLIITAFEYFFVVQTNRRLEANFKKFYQR